MLFANYSTRTYLLLAVTLLVLMCAVLFAMGRPFLCYNGSLKLWYGKVFSSQISQHLTDWYTFSHISHGLLLYLLLCWLLPDFPFGARLLLAIFIEAGWEVFENTEFMIKYYRQNTMAIAFYGDTILNSLCDVLAMILGFWTARKLPVYATLLLFLALEIGLIYFIRDSFLLNVLMFIYPFEFLKQWQLPPSAIPGG